MTRTTQQMHHTQTRTRTRGRRTARARWSCAAVALSLLSVALLPAIADATAIDPATSKIGFDIRTRWGQVLEGTFPTYTGDIEAFADGRQRVRLQLSTADVVIVGNDSYTQLTRGSGFFDAARYPSVNFESDPYTAQLTRTGGALGGMLEIRGVRRREVFTIAPAVCDTPGVGCDVVATGSVDRNDYGVDRWGFAIGSRVVFTLRVRVYPATDA